MHVIVDSASSTVWALWLLLHTPSSFNTISLLSLTPVFRCLLCNLRVADFSINRGFPSLRQRSSLRMQSVLLSGAEVSACSVGPLQLVSKRSFGLIIDFRRFLLCRRVRRLRTRWIWMSTWWLSRSHWEFDSPYLLTARSSFTLLKKGFMLLYCNRVFGSLFFFNWLKLMQNLVVLNAYKLFWDTG